MNISSNPGLFTDSADKLLMLSSDAKITLKDSTNDLNNGQVSVSWAGFTPSSTAIFSGDNHADQTVGLNFLFGSAGSGLD